MKFVKFAVVFVAGLFFTYVFAISFVVTFRNGMRLNPLGFEDTVGLIWVSLWDVGNFGLFLVVLFLSSVLTAMFNDLSS